MRYAQEKFRVAVTLADAINSDNVFTHCPLYNRKHAKGTG